MNKSISQNRGAIKASFQPKQNKSRKPRKERPIAASKDEVKVAAPISKGRIVRQNRPKTIPMPNGDILIRHREYVQDATGSAAFSASSLAINPGLPGTFPWLSTLARSFESYRFEKLSILYETQSPTTSAGKALLAVDYDASDAAPTTKQQAMAYRSSVSAPVWSDCEHNSLKEDLEKRKSYYVRSGALDANSDVKLYDIGNLFVCSQGSTGLVGEIYIDYVVRLMTPQLGKVGVGQAIYGIFTGTSNAAPYANRSGILPATVISTGTTTSTSTWTFTQPWEGYVSFALTGTTLGNMTPGGTATQLELKDVLNTTSTDEAVIYSLVANPGETFSVLTTNAGISASAAYFAQADA